jgi:hypothetical protein
MPHQSLQKVIYGQIHYLVLFAAALGGLIVLVPELYCVVVPGDDPLERSS